MNELSWMIYLAEVVGRMREPALILGLICGGWAAICVFVPAYDKVNWRVVRRFALAGAGFLLIAGFAPSTRTVYAIAASEIGEDALRSETGGKAMRALNAWLDRQIEGSEEAGNDE